MLRRFAVGMAIALAACGGEATIDDRVTLTGLVTDAETGAALAGVKITTEPETLDVTTDLDGRYEITGVRRNLVLQITAAMAGYDTATRTLTTMHGENVADFPLQL